MGFYLSRAADDLFVRPRVLADNVTPSGNGVALRVLRDLSMMTGDDRYRAAADRTVSALGSSFERSPQSVGTAVRALALGPQLPAPPLAASDDASPKPSIALDKLPTGRDFVKADLLTAPDQPAGKHRELLVRLQIAEGWHVNANPASLAFLIPTSVAPAKPGTSVDIRYPASVAYHPRFSLEPLAVYEGQMDIRVRPEKTLDASSAFDVTFQACDATSCLPPETVRLEAPSQEPRRSQEPQR
jgi:hypothetical protein